jgi:two-component system sensor histidine kinase ChiS
MYDDRPALSHSHYYARPHARVATRAFGVAMRITGMAMLVLIGAFGSARAAGVDDCREARRAAPGGALAVCTAALKTADDADAAFEIQLHLVELHTAKGELDEAALRLDAAEAMLAAVTDPLAAHRVARRRGMLEYRRGDMARALARFLDGLKAARAANDLRATAVSENDLGVVYRRLGEDQQALAQWLASLEHKRESGETDLAATEDNIGNLYRDLKAPEQARQYLERALAGHREKDRVLLAAHTVEDLGLLAADGGDLVQARRLMDESWAIFEREHAPIDRLRLARHRAELEWRAGEHGAAREWGERARALANELGQPAPIDMVLLQARGLAADGDTAAAYALLANHHPAPGDDDLPLAQAWAEALSTFALTLGRTRDALAHAGAAHRAEVALLQRRHGERMDALRVRFEFSELEHERDRLRRDNAEQALALQQRRNQLLGLGIACVLLIAGLLVFYQRRLYRQRMRAQQIEAQHRVQAIEAQRVSESLRADLRSLRVALDQSSEPVLVVDAGGVIRLATTAAAQLLGRPQSALAGAALADVFGADAAARLQAALERLSSGETPSPVQIVTGADGAPSIRAMSLALEEELGVLSLAAAHDQSGAWVESLNEAHARWEHGGGETPESGDEAPASAAARQAIVELMQASLEAWERSTCSTRLELAEKSGIWRVTIDDGRLRTRTLNRYLDHATLPARPRWREVLRTAYFVLAECRLDAVQRDLLNARIGSLQQLMRGSAAAVLDRGGR